MGRWPLLLAFLVATVTLTEPLRAQIDPQYRRVVQMGYTQPIQEHGPLEAYGFFYYNRPGFIETNLTLRLAVAPVYLDSELGVSDVLGTNTDLAIGLAGGGWRDSYNEIRQGDYITGESFLGDSGEASISLYHLINPTQRAPLHAILRTSVHRAFYKDDDDTANNFEVPHDQTIYTVRTGLRLGGREPYLTPSLAAELSFWYEGRFRRQSHRYGFNNDRAINANSHLFWSRALIAYTFEESQNFMEFSLTMGTTHNADRFGAYRLGGNLPLIAEFPLTLPGYHREEISARQFAQLSGNLVIPLDPGKRIALSGYGALAIVDYLRGVGQPGDFHSGVGGGLLYRTRSRAWQVGVAYAYGINAIRESGRGAHAISVVAQYDLDAVTRAGNRPFWDPIFSANTWRGFLNSISGN